MRQPRHWRPACLLPPPPTMLQLDGVIETPYHRQPIRTLNLFGFLADWIDSSDEAVNRNICIRGVFICRNRPDPTLRVPIVSK
jgi:hypothetical protein